MQAKERWEALAFEDSFPVANWGKQEWIPLPLNIISFGWGPPPSLWLKIHFDGGLNPVTGKGGAGFLIRKEQAIAEGLRVYGLSVPLAELIGAWTGLRFAVEVLGASRVWMEGYSITLVQWVKKRRARGGYAQGLLDDILHWIERLVGFHQPPISSCSRPSIGNPSTFSI